MRDLRTVALLLLLTLAASGQTLLNARRLPDGGSASYRPPISIRPAVTGAPVFYELHEVRVQTLADGTRITHTVQLQRFWRDSQGRTRLDRFYITPEYEANPRVSIWPTAEIYDPVSRFWYLLDQEGKIAHRSPLPTATPAAPSGSFLLPGSEDIGTQTINGVLAQGQRTISMIPTNAQGNDRPLVTTTETWMSPELGITMARETHDPRNGDATLGLENFSQDEPDGSLFALPADFRIIDESGPVTVSWGTLPPTALSARTPGGGGASAPVPISVLQPSYTEAARRAKIEGTVLLNLVVDQDGKPRQIQVIRPLDPGLDQKAIQAVSKWRFRPGQKDGKPLAVITNVEVNFRLLDNPQE